MCEHLKEFLQFQRLLIIREAERSGRPIEEVAKDWIIKNSKEVRNVYCSFLCPNKRACREKKN